MPNIDPIINELSCALFNTMEDLEMPIDAEYIISKEGYQKIMKYTAWKTEEAWYYPVYNGAKYVLDKYDNNTSYQTMDAWAFWAGCISINAEYYGTNALEVSKYYTAIKLNLIDKMNEIREEKKALVKTIVWEVMSKQFQNTEDEMEKVEKEERKTKSDEVIKKKTSSKKKKIIGIENKRRLLIDEKWNGDNDKKIQVVKKENLNNLNIGSVKEKGFIIQILIIISVIFVIFFLISILYNNWKNNNLWYQEYTQADLEKIIYELYPSNLDYDRIKSVHTDYDNADKFIKIIKNWDILPKRSQEYLTIAFTNVILYWLQDINYRKNNPIRMLKITPFYDESSYSYFQVFTDDGKEYPSKEKHILIIIDERLKDVRTVDLY